MKTVPELIRDADSLNKLMTSTHETQTHLISTIDDEYAQDVYLTLLMSVAETAGQFDETRNNPLAYVCKIAAELPVTPDMQEIFRRSLLIDEKILNDYSVTLKQHNLQNLLLFDALNMQILYAKDAAQMSEYIAGLANVFGTGTDGLSEILSIVKAVINREENFSQKFQHVNCFEFLSYIRRSCRNIFIEAPDIFFADFEKLTDCNKRINYVLSWNNLKLVHFRNVYLHHMPYYFKATDTETVEIEGCTFQAITAYTLIKDFGRSGNLFFVPDDFKFLKCERCRTVSFVNCTFTDNTGNFIDFSEGTDYFFAKYDDRGLLIWIEDLHDLVVRDCVFKNCYFREMFPNATYGMYTDGRNFMTFREKFGNRNNFTYQEYVERARVDLTRGTLISGWTKFFDINNNTIINSLAEA